MTTQTSITALFGFQLPYPSSSSGSDDLSSARNDLTTICDESDLLSPMSLEPRRLGFVLTTVALINLFLRHQQSRLTTHGSGTTESESQRRRTHQCASFSVGNATIASPQKSGSITCQIRPLAPINTLKRSTTLGSMVLRSRRRRGRTLLMQLKR